MLFGDSSMSMQGGLEGIALLGLSATAASTASSAPPELLSPLPLESGAEKAHVLAEEKSRDHLGLGALDVFSHLLRLDPYFDFAAMLDPVPETISAALAEWVEFHVEDLVTRLAPEGDGMSSGDDESP
ncbi:hypothetical protein D1007_61382 [Hordeum vulgare]|nr:hypothetical protein D1007_61382 [Hordeum vulgare]